MMLVAFKQANAESRFQPLSFTSLGRHKAARSSKGHDGATLGCSKFTQFLTEHTSSKVPKTPPYDPVISATIREFNTDISREGSEKLARLIEGTANMYGVDPYLVAALVSQESAFYANAVSPVGALGLGQLMPGTASDLGVNPRIPKENLDGCVRYLAQNLDTWSHTKDPIAYALASYNAGPGAVARFGGVPPYQETRHYVAVIKQRYSQLRARA